MKRSCLFALFVLVVVVWSTSANGDCVIDTNGTWDGNVNNGWFGSGQSLTVPLGCTIFESIGFYFDEAANGQVFTFELNDAMNGGNTLFTTNFVVGSGIT